MLTVFIDLKVPCTSNVSLCTTSLHLQLMDISLSIYQGLSPVQTVFTMAALIAHCYCRSPVVAVLIGR